MEFVETRFPTDIAYGSTGGPEFLTEIVITEDGNENRTTNWDKCRSRYNVTPGVKTQSQLEALIAFFRARKGRAVGFRFKDWTDYQAYGQVLGEGDGVRRDFRLVKRYPSCDEIRVISKPVPGTHEVRVNGVVQSTGYTVNVENGVVSFSTPLVDGSVITASFEFDVPVRFDTDRISASLDSYGSQSWQDIPLIEIRTDQESRGLGD